MKFKKILRQLFYPKPIGTIDFKGKKDRPDAKYTIFHFLLSLLIIGGLEYLFYDWGADNKVQFILKSNLILLIYILVASLIRVRPNYENLGWVPFLVNDPFRVSDNVNRFLIYLEVLFLPGKYVFHSILGFYYYLGAKFRG